MAIELSDVKSGYSTPIINSNFQEIENELNNNVLRRDGLETGEPNHMEVPLDMNGFPILNVGTDTGIGSSLLTLEVADARYVNVSGDAMEGNLSMGTFSLFIREATEPNEPIRKSTFDQLEGEVLATIAAIEAVGEGDLTAVQDVPVTTSTGTQPLKEALDDPRRLVPNSLATRDFSFLDDENINLGSLVGASAFSIENSPLVEIDLAFDQGPSFDLGVLV